MSDDQNSHFGFTKLVVTDLDASAAFYTAVFGVVEQYRVTAEIAGRGIDEILFAATRSGGATFALLRFADQTGASHNEVILGFIVHDIHAVFERVTAAGGAVAQPIETQPQHGVHVGFVTDPEGHLIEVVQLIQETSTP